MSSKRRLYYGALLRRIRYSPAWQGHEAGFTAQIVDNDRRMHVYEAPTIDEIVALIKADGWPVWGKDVLEYSFPPENALEYVLMEQALKAEGFNDAQIQIEFSLYSTDEIEALPPAT